MASGAHVVEYFSKNLSLGKANSTWNGANDLEVTGVHDFVVPLKFTETLSVGTTYEAVFLIKMKEGSSGWDDPVTLQLDAPGIHIENHADLSQIVQKIWTKIAVGKFKYSQNMVGNAITISLSSPSKSQKSGLVISEVIISPYV